MLQHSFDMKTGLVQDKHALPWGARAAPGQTLTYDDLPPHLVALGEKLFGSQEKTRERMAMLAPVSPFSDNGVNLMAVSFGQNDVVGIGREMNGDRYSVRQLPKEDGLIIDVGSNIGDFAMMASKIHPNMQVMAFEPAPTTYFLLRLNLWINHVQELEEKDLGKPGKFGVLAMHGAVTSDARPVEIAYEPGWSVMASVNAHGPATENWERAMVPSWDLRSFLQQHGISKVRLFKIDCEGCEFEVIPSLKEMFTDKTLIERAVGEIHQYLRDPNTNTFQVGQLVAQDQSEAIDTSMKSRGCVVSYGSLAELHC
jgi:FkbM family methyltransferase